MCSATDSGVLCQKYLCVPSRPEIREKRLSLLKGTAFFISSTHRTQLMRGRALPARRGDSSRKQSVNWCRLLHYSQRDKIARNKGQKYKKKVIIQLNDYHLLQISCHQVALSCINSMHYFLYSVTFVKAARQIFAWQVRPSVSLDVQSISASKKSGVQYVKSFGPNRLRTSIFSSLYHTPIKFYGYDLMLGCFTMVVESWCLHHHHYHLNSEPSFEFPSFYKG